MTGSLIMFAPSDADLDVVRRDMPLLRTLRVQAGWGYWHERHDGGWSDYVGWAAEAALRPMRRGFDVRLQLYDHPEDFERLPDACVDVTRSMLDYRVRTKVRRKGKNARPRFRWKESRPEGRLLGMLFDSEWENVELTGPGGWVAWHQGMTPAMQAMRQRHPGVELCGPGGTHSDDETLVTLLEAIDRDGVRPDVFTAHVYFDKGWDVAEQRLADLKEIARRFGYERFAVSETGVHGADSSSREFDDGLHGNEIENHTARYARMFELWESDPDIEWWDGYQFKDAPGFDRVEHGPNRFGNWDSDLTPKPCVSHWQA